MKTSQTHYPSFIGAFLFAAAALILFAVAFILGMSVLFVYFNDGFLNVQTVIRAAAIAFLGALLAGIAVVALQKFLNKPAADAAVATSIPGRQIVIGVAFAGLALLLGQVVRNDELVNWLALPILTIPAVMLPLWIITALAVRHLPLGSRWRTWGAFGVSLTAVPLLLIVIELFMFMVIFAVVIFYVVANPQLSAEFQGLSSQVMFLDLETEAGADELLRLLAPFIVRPGVFIPVLIVLSGLIPLLEELIKPLAVWLLAGRLSSAAQGFALGALSGAGFAIWETFNASGQTDGWGVLLFTRIGTGLLHIVASAIMGMGIYLAVRERRYLRLLGSYLLAVLLHGLWNAAALTVSFSALGVTYIQPDGYEELQQISTIGLVVLAGILLALLVAFNRKLQQTLPVSVPEETPALPNDTSL